jgi:hypothetical protein
MFQAQYSFKHMAICAKALAFRYSSARASVFSLANWQVEAGEQVAGNLHYCNYSVVYMLERE